jgi:hypothetical protein
MNYLAHSLSCLANPYEVAGAAVPDWLGMTRPRLRCRSRQAAPWVEADEPLTAAVARGVMRHHADDEWFHNTVAFNELSVELARRVRHATADDDGMRPSFLGHILVELLLDATLIAEERCCADDYYAALSLVDGNRVAAAVGKMIGVDAASLAPIIERFVEIKFLYDYQHDESLTFRLNQVMRRVGLPALPPRFIAILPDARRLIAASRDELLAAPAARTAPMLAALAC